MANGNPIFAVFIHGRQTAAHLFLRKLSNYARDYTREEIDFMPRAASAAKMCTVRL